MPEAGKAMGGVLGEQPKTSASCRGLQLEDGATCGMRHGVTCGITCPLSVVTMAVVRGFFVLELGASLLSDMIEQKPQGPRYLLPSSSVPWG